MGGRGRFIVGVVLLFGALAYFSYSAFQGSTVYYFTVSEVLSQADANEGITVRVSGKLLRESFHRESGSTIARFTIVDDTQELMASYDGVLPDLFFNERSAIVLEGVYGQNRVFAANNVIVKCPSKYESEEAYSSSA